LEFVFLTPKPGANPVTSDLALRDCVTIDTCK